MSAPIPALINPPLLSWAREQSGYSPESVAKRLNVKPEKLLAWERGDVRPTVRQAQALAKIYHRPFGVLFLPQPPSVAPLATEYRRLPGVEPGRESPELRLALRVMSERRELALDLSDELGSTIPEFQFTAHLAEGPDAVGRRLRKLLGISNEEQITWRDEWQAWRRWREAVESVGVQVYQFPKVALEQVRGLALLLFPMPVIGINSKEFAPGARMFTLLHELVHIALANGREETDALHESRNDADWREIERFTEEAASAALIPQELLATFLERLDVGRGGWTLELMRSLASKFRVTPLAMATRLRTAGVLSWTGYRAWKDAWQKYLATLKKRKGGFASPVDKTLGRSGRPFSRLVLDAMDSNRITAVDACRYLDLRFHHFEKLRRDLVIGSSRTHTFAEDGE